MSKVAVLHLPVGGFQKEGDTIYAKEFEFDASDDIDLTGATIKMQLYCGVKKVFDVGTDVGGITINNDKKFTIDKVDAANNNLAEGKFTGDLQIELSNGNRFTPFNVVFTVVKEYTI